MYGVDVLEFLIYCTKDATFSSICVHKDVTQSNFRFMQERISSIHLLFFLPKVSTSVLIASSIHVYDIDSLK